MLIVIKRLLDIDGVYAYIITYDKSNTNHSLRLSIIMIFVIIIISIQDEVTFKEFQSDE